MRGQYSAIGQRTFFSGVRRVDFINQHGCQRSCRKNEKEELCAIGAGNTRCKQCNQHTAKGTAGEHKAGRGCGVPGEADGRVADDKRIDGCKAEGNDCIIHTPFFLPETKCKENGFINFYFLKYALQMRTDGVYYIRKKQKAGWERKMLDTACAL